MYIFLNIKKLGIYLGLLAIGGGAGMSASQYLVTERQPNPESAAAIAPAKLQARVLPNPFASANVNFIAEAVEKVGPAVVRIDATRQVAKHSKKLDIPFFDEFFDEELSPPGQQVERGTGSGFIITPDGHLLTNAHVIDGMKKIEVTLKNGQTYEGKVLGTDALTDVAVVKIDGTDLPTATLGETKNLTPGEWAIAIGNPLGLDNTVTVGIISAINRSSAQVGVFNKRVRFIQTDAAINPGNSGGPLLNSKGEVIGINTAIRADAQGLGFAIPIEIANRIARQLFAKGKADHPYLGVQMLGLDIGNRQARFFKGQSEFDRLPNKGVLITGVFENSPAQKAGIQAGDVIHRIGDRFVDTEVELQEQVDLSQIGEPLKIEIRRNGRTEVLEVRPEKFPDRFG